MRQRFFYLMTLVSIAILPHCGQGPDTGAMDAGVEDTGNAPVERLSLSLAPGLTMEEALSVVSNEGMNPELEVTISWPEHSSHVAVPAATVHDQGQWLLNYESTHLQFLMSHFNPNEEMEQKISSQLSDVLHALRKTSSVPITHIDVDLDQVSSEVTTHPWVKDATVSVESDDEGDGEEGEGDHNGEVTLAGDPAALIIDESDDAAYVPTWGTSIVGETGSFQLFWLNEDVKQQLVDREAGIEVKTLIIPRKAAKCGTDWDTNLPEKEYYAYRDTEFCDGSICQSLIHWPFIRQQKARICSIGYVYPELLQTGENDGYWVSRSFKKFKPELNPTIQIQWAPTKMYEVDYPRDAYLELAAQGFDFKWKWLMFSRDDMPIEWLVEYQYNDAPGQEVSWYSDYGGDGTTITAAGAGNQGSTCCTYSSLDLTSQAAMDYIDPPSRPQVYIDPATDYLHVVTNGVDRRIDEISYDGTSWSSLDLTSEAAVPYAAPGTSPMGFSDADKGMRYVVFNGNNARIQMFSYDGVSWQSTDLTSQAAVDYADINAEPYAYVHPYTGNIHVVFTGSNRRIYEFTYDGVQWTSLDLTSQAPVDYAAAGTSPMGFGDPNSPQRFVVFNSQGGRTQYFQYTGSSWQSLDLTALAPVDNADLNAAPFGIMDPFNGYLYVVFNGQDGHIYEFTYDGSRWTSTDLSAQTPFPYSLAGASPMIAINPSTENRSVVFTANNRRIQQFTHTGAGWTGIDLTSQAAVEYAAPATSPSLFVHPDTGEQFVVFAGENARIQMIRDGRR